MKNLEARVLRLERMNRLLLLALVAVVTLGWVSRADTISAERFEVIGADGSARMVLEATEVGPALRFFDDGGVERVLLTDDADGTRLYLSDEAGDTRVGVAQFPHGGGGFALHGPGGKGAAVLYLKGTGSLSMIDDEGTVTDRFPAG